jgi:hypothetical protein
VIDYTPESRSLFSSFAKRPSILEYLASSFLHEAFSGGRIGHIWSNSNLPLNRLPESWLLLPNNNLQSIRFITLPRHKNRSQFKYNTYDLAITPSRTPMPSSLILRLSTEGLSPLRLSSPQDKRIFLIFMLSLADQLESLFRIWVPVKIRSFAEFYRQLQLGLWNSVYWFRDGSVPMGDLPFL